MTHLRKIMLEELERRNYAQSTIHSYLRAVAEFSLHFHRPPNQLGPDHIRQYQAHLFGQRKLAPSTVTQRLAALRFFYVKTLLRKVFRRKFVIALKRNFRQGKLAFHGTLKPLAHPKAFSAWLRTLYRHHWHVYSKRPFAGAEHTLRYLGRYTHRVAISNHRLVSLVDDQVTFRWRDRTHHNEPKLMTLSLDEFLRRFLLHLLPRGFVRIRHFGFLANRRRATLLPLCFQVLGPIPRPQIEPAASAADQPSPLYRCPKCGGTMVIIKTLTAAQILLRSPPSFLRAA